MHVCVWTSLIAHICAVFVCMYSWVFMNIWKQYFFFFLESKNGSLFYCTLIRANSWHVYNIIFVNDSINCMRNLMTIKDFNVTLCFILFLFCHVSWLCYVCAWLHANDKRIAYQVLTCELVSERKSRQIGIFISPIQQPYELVLFCSKRW